MYPQHLLSCCALYLANRLCRRPVVWSDQLQLASGYRPQDLRTCAKKMCSHLKKMRCGSNSLTAVKRKFSSDSFLRVSLLPEFCWGADHTPLSDLETEIRQPGGRQYPSDAGLPHNDINDITMVQDENLHPNSRGLDYHRFQQQGTMLAKRRADQLADCEPWVGPELAKAVQQTEAQQSLKRLKPVGLTQRGSTGRAMPRPLEPTRLSKHQGSSCGQGRQRN